MGEMDIIRGSVTGKLGALSGARRKGQNVIRAAPFSKAPPSALQTQNVRAFEKLNRLSGAIARLNFQALGLSDKKVLKHNAVASLLKPAIANHLFEPGLIGNVIAPDGAITSLFMLYDSTAYEVQLRVSLDVSYAPLFGAYMYVVFFDDLGTVHYAVGGYPANSQFTFLLERNPARHYYALAFLSDPKQKGRYLHGFIMREAWNMRYSTQEQATGDLWVDGKMIYQKTFVGTINIPASNDAVYNQSYAIDATLNQTYVQTFVSAEWVGMNNITGVHQHFAPPNSIGEAFQMAATGLNIQLRSFNMPVTFGASNFNYNVTVKYTKVND